jgi:hypothetical protein
MLSPSEAVHDVIAGGRGARPASLRDEEAETVLNIALALLVELCNATDRIDRLEREIAALRGMALADWRETLLDEDAVTERQQAIEALQLRVMRILVDPRTKHVSEA